LHGARHHALLDRSESLAAAIDAAARRLRPRAARRPGGGAVRRGGAGRGAATAMVVGSIVSVQSGSALATTLFEEVGSMGAVFLRAAVGAVALVALTRRDLARMRGRPVGDVVLFGAVVAGINVFFYAAIARLPLGVAVTLEFVGPLGVALAGSRRARDALWALMAAAGIAMLSGGLGGAVDPLGVALALTAGGFWAAYILLSARVGANHPGLGGVALAAVVSALLVAGPGIARGGAELFSPEVLAAGLGVGLLSTAVPFALELEALRRLPQATFGVLMSLEPAVGAVIGFLALSQGLSAPEAVAIGLVVCASAGALGAAGADAPHGR